MCCCTSGVAVVVVAVVVADVDDHTRVGCCCQGLLLLMPRMSPEAEVQICEGFVRKNSFKRQDRPRFGVMRGGLGCSKTVV